MRPFIYFMKQNKTLVRMILILTTACAILLSSLSAFLFKQYSEKSVRDAYGISAEQLEQTYRMIEAQLMNVYNYYARFYSSSSHVFNALYADQFNSEEMYEINKTLKDSMQVSPLVSSVYIINRNADAAFSSGSTVKAIGDFYDTDIVSDLKAGYAVNHPVFIPRDVRYRIYDKWEEHRFISVIFSESSSANTADSALVINISQDKIREIMAMKPENAQTHKMIVDHAGVVVVQTESPMQMKLEETFFHTIQAQGSGSGYFTEKIQGKNYFITHLKSSSILGWYFINIMEYDQLVSGISSLRDAVFTITGLFILLSAIVSLFFIRSLYKPVHRLIHKVKSGGRMGVRSSSSGEFEFLRDAFDHLTADISDLNHSKEDAVLFLIGSTDGKPLPGLHGTFSGIQEEIGKNLKLSVTVAFGPVFSQLSEIRKSYFGALNAANCRIRLGKGAIIDQDAVLDNGKEPYIYPHEAEKRLLNSLKLEEEDKFNQSLHLFVQMASQFSYDEMILSFTQLTLAVMKTATSQMQVDPERLDIQRSHISKQLAERETFEEIQIWYRELYATIVQAVNERKDSKQSDMVKQLVDYISVHYDDANLSVESLADQVQLSPNHLRLIVKKQLGKSLSEYITDIRFMHAMRMLRETDERIKDIAEKVGFVNTGYFYTSFKKYVGVSAAQYREDHKTEQSS
ncbi:helix-turn-helix domain-containing protein [Paenibacillus nasutitermitis]|uniref:HTH araC/xylS-type domain-containing protein n=1 Tax=Paenibacillus nasutitermitis TaxID=1652958 RepID=A0A916Z6A7_9BACL|nr:helix-turn-helix domain-containing protein [Paenibacillus nasutitermitis]GGD78682.1 hypothetical protein GCM10010911_40940 [Paenibacillus nasutitermitis]